MDLGIQKIAVIGTGLMGHGIAQTFAGKDYYVNLVSRKKESLEKAIKEITWSLDKFVKKGLLTKFDADNLLSKIKTTTNYKDAVRNVDLVLESVSENLEMKKLVFSKVDKFAPSKTIIATNTSTLSVSEMGKATDRPEKTVGMHWFVPPQLTSLIEVIKGDKTSDETLEVIFKISKSLGKTPILCKKDTRGFIVSRILVSMFNEALWTYSRKEASILEIDASVKFSGFPMGWFELIDYVGVDLEYDVSKILYKAHGKRFHPRLELIKPLLNEKKLGRKSGKGFYDWSKGRPKISSKFTDIYDVERSWVVAVNEAAYMVRDDVADPKSIDLGMKLGTSWPSGPCEYADNKGIDWILKKLKKEYNRYQIELYKPCSLLEKYVKKGWTGKKSGHGFFKYY